MPKNTWRIEDIRKAMSEKIQKAFYETAQAAGLTGDEAHTLQKLCQSWPLYATYETQLAQNRELAKQPGVELATIGYSRDSNRPIELCAVGNPEAGGVNGYIQGPDHAPELLGATTTSVLKELTVYHPDLTRRMGYDGMLFCDHIDIDGMAMQTWNRRRPTFRRFAYGAYRGHWSDQPSWSYPAVDYYPESGPAYRDRQPEAAASLDVLRTYQPYFFGSMHGSTFSSYVVSSRNDTAMAKSQSRLIQDYGLRLNHDEPEQPRTPVLAPGVFGVENKETFVQTLNEQPAVQATGGTNASDHIRADGLMLIPEIAWIEGLPTSNRPQSYTRLEAIEYRTQHAKQLIAEAARGLDDLDRWLENHTSQPEVCRLRDAAIFWRDFVDPQLDAELLEAQQNPNRHTHIDQVKFAQLVGTTICNALIAAGNVYTLARNAKNKEVAVRLRNVIDQGMDSLRPNRLIPLEAQLATQALVTLIGMRHALA